MNGNDVFICCNYSLYFYHALVEEDVGNEQCCKSGT